MKVGIYLLKFSAWLRLVDFLTSVSVRSLVSPLGDTPTGVLEDALEETPPFALEDSTFLDLFCKHSCSWSILNQDLII